MAAPGLEAIVTMGAELNDMRAKTLLAEADALLGFGASVGLCR
jgi:hypothetical protein